MSATEGEAQATQMIRERLNYERLSISHRAMRSSGDIVSHPAFLLNSGNTVLAWSTKNPASVAVQGFATIAIAFLVAKASWQNKPVHLPFYLLGALNITTAALGVGTYAAGHGLPRIKRCGLFFSAMPPWQAGDMDIFVRRAR